MNNYDYPEGADTSSAPWNEKETEYEKVDVNISMNISKTFTLSLPKNCSDRWLKDLVRAQVWLPTEACKCITIINENDVKILDDISGWNIDEFEIEKV